MVGAVGIFFEFDYTKLARATCILCCKANPWDTSCINLWLVLFLSGLDLQSKMNSGNDRALKVIISQTWLFKEWIEDLGVFLNSSD